MKSFFRCFRRCIMKKLALFLLACASATGVGAACDLENNNNAISKILANGKSAIIADEGDRIYVDPEKLHTTAEGIFLELDNRQPVLLTTLHSDVSGCFVQYRSIKVTKKCPLCGEERLSGAFKCPNPDCESNQKTDQG
jgi:hypothetical protein